MTGEELTDLIRKALDDSMCPDWTTQVGAKAVVMAMARKRHLLIHRPRMESAGRPLPDHASGPAKAERHRTAIEMPHKDG